MTCFTTQVTTWPFFSSDAALAYGDLRVAHGAQCWLVAIALAAVVAQVPPASDDFCYSLQIYGGGELWQPRGPVTWAGGHGSVTIKGGLHSTHKTSALLCLQLLLRSSD